jgi:hypothetical protein
MIKKLAALVLILTTSFYFAGCATTGRTQVDPNYAAYLAVANQPHFKLELTEDGKVKSISMYEKPQPYVYQPTGWERAGEILAKGFAAALPLGVGMYFGASIMHDAFNAAGHNTSTVYGSGNYQGTGPVTQTVNTTTTTDMPTTTNTANTTGPGNSTIH